MRIDKVKFWFLKYFLTKLFSPKICGAQNKKFDDYRFLWASNSDVVFDNESKNRKKIGCSGPKFGVKVQNTEILTFLKIIILWVIVQNTCAKGYYCFWLRFYIENKRKISVNW